MNDITSLRKRSQRAAIFLGMCLLTLAACRKPEDGIGLTVQPDADRLGLTVVDTSTILSYTVEEDSLVTSNLSFNLLGSYSDPQFGFVSAAIATQIRLGAFIDNDDLDLANIEIDSVVLALRYTGDSYGTTDFQRFRVYKVTEDMTTDSVLFSNYEVANDGNDLIKLGYQIMAPDPLSDVPVGDDTLGAQMRIRLDESFGWELFNESVNGTLNDQAAFNTFLNGLYIVPDNNIPPEEYGGIFTFDLEDGNSKLSVYYRNTLPGAEDTIAYDFIIDDNAVRYTHYELDRTGSPLDDAINNPSTGQMDLFVQSMGGSKVKIEFPHLMNYVDSGMVAFNRAELHISVDDSLTGQYLPHERMLVFAVPEDGEGPGNFLIDFFEGEAYHDGFWEPSTNDYRINITRHLQQILTGAQPNTGLYLIPASSGITANRTIIHGPEDTKEPLRLELVYTTY